MLKRIGMYVGHVLLWLLLVTMVVWAVILYNKHRNSRCVEATDITISGGERTPLIDAESIAMWLKETPGESLYPDGVILSKVDVAAIEHRVEEHNAVASANVYVTYDLRVKIDIEQRKPIARARFEGYDMYVTEDGFVFSASGCKAAHVLVITGDYCPMFDADYTGHVQELMCDSIASLDRYIEELELQKIPYLEEHIENNRRLRVIKRATVKRGLFQSDEEYEILVNHYKQQVSEAVEAHSDVARRINSDIAALERKQEEAQLLQRGLREQVRQFEAMTAMIAAVGRDKFLAADVTQLVASGGKQRPLQLEYVPRSGDFIVDLGTTENLDKKFASLRRFYDDGLSNIGWSKYKHISLRYDGQVVCR